MQLIRHIKAEHSKFFPLRGFVSNRALVNDVWVITPTETPQYRQYNDVDTACATPSGCFVFNRQFCQTLMDYSAIKGLKGNSKKYKSQGGPIPDEYAYIEFTIMHELMHYSEDDFYYQHIIPNANTQIINYVGDFRTNYTLVKSGYPQLPVGLFNDLINYDRQTKYTDMYDLVKQEMERMKDEDKSEVEQQLDDSSADDHEPGQDQASGDSSSSKDDQSKNEQNDKEGKEGKGGKEGKEGKESKEDKLDHSATSTNSPLLT